MPNQPKDALNCHSCNLSLDFLGTKKFHEGTRAFDVLGGLFELLKNRESYDVYACRRCGRLEFFLDNVGDDLRDSKTDASVALEDPPETVDESEMERIDCLNCFTPIPANETKCANCGWTYQAR